MFKSLTNLKKLLCVCEYLFKVLFKSVSIVHNIVLNLSATPGELKTKPGKLNQTFIFDYYFRLIIGFWARPAGQENLVTATKEHVPLHVNSAVRAVM
jgi:hypothetical protein